MFKRIVHYLAFAATFAPNTGLAAPLDAFYPSGGVATMVAAPNGTATGQCADPLEPVTLQTSIDLSDGLRTDAAFLASAVRTVVVKRGTIRQSVQTGTGQSQHFQRAFTQPQENQPTPLMLVGQMTACKFRGLVEITGGTFQLNGEVGNFVVATTSSLTDITSQPDGHVGISVTNTLWETGPRPHWRAYRLQSDQSTQSYVEVIMNWNNIPSTATQGGDALDIDLTAVLRFQLTQ